MNGAELLDALPVAVYTTDASGRITYYNDAAAELWGRRPEIGSIRWCGSWRLYRPDGRPLPYEECPMAVALREGRPVRGADAIAERPDGTRVHFLPYPTPLFDSAGRLTGAVNLLLDISERRHTDIEAARLAAIVSSSDDAIISKTLDGVVTSWNASAARIFGYEASEMIGQPIAMIIPPELLSEEEQILSKLRRGERIDHYETVRVAKDGRRVDISLTVSPIHDRAGVVIGASKVARDVTERKRAEALQRLLMDELNHRVKNTLATVQAIANQTLRRAKSPADFANSLSGRVQALARAHTLLTESSWRGAELMGLVRDQLLLSSADDERISWLGPSLMLDPQVSLHLALVIHELGTNARKYGALSVPNGRLSVSWEVESSGKRTLFLTWKESGGPRVSAPSGRGFGTTLIEQSLQAHGGVARISYAADGLTCEIQLPLPEQPRQDPYSLVRSGARDAATRLIENAQLRLEGKAVLVVEDEPLVAMDIVSWLCDAGCSVAGPVATVAGAIALIEKERLDAALVDANLDGDPVDAIASALTRRNVSFAFVTGYGREVLPRAFKDAPMIGKPFTQQQLLAALTALIGRDPSVVPLRHKPA